MTGKKGVKKPPVATKGDFDVFNNWTLPTLSGFTKLFNCKAAEVPSTSTSAGSGKGKELRNQSETTIKVQSKRPG